MLEFTRAAYDAVVDHARRGEPREVCGVLAGMRGAPDSEDADRAESLVTEALPTENVAERPETRYRIDPEELFAVVESIEGDGLEVVGFYHSHPAGPPRPSETDVARATWTDHSYAICALDGHPFVGSWRWRGTDEGFDREVVAVRSERSDA
ncbi:desampylase [Halorubrum aquaticum]|uniref:desampylase n=1 Tax=Halorubrum aquaticum TaxID=387340 RepID=UPI00122D4BF1|nr:desampylase [Halorubrum aquaticum]